ncbi:MAG: hypothetical protein MUP98_13065, partial [Candidatus Aminicenantes bacterium]|nr:hypothetical protein [Candidatus Aminicenantes bacterium]
KIDDVQVVTNPNYPRDGIIRDILEEELSIGLIEGPDEYMLNRPKGAGTGRLWLSPLYGPVFGRKNLYYESG